jgi:hypothetical protein
MIGGGTTVATSVALPGIAVAAESSGNLNYGATMPTEPEPWVAPQFAVLPLGDDGAVATLTVPF